MNKEELIKQIRKDMRTMKNQWVFKEYDYKGHKIQTKRWNNWFQIFRSPTNPNLNIHFSMEMNQGEVIKQIEARTGEIKTQFCISDIEFMEALE